MCEETSNHLWATQDILGHGATSQVYKAYNKTTGVLVAAKVYQVSSNTRSPYREQRNYPRERDFRPILDREMDILKAADHENIVRYIALEPVISSDATHLVGTQEALLIEYCNGGSLHNVLESPENRYGLMEDEYILVFKHLTKALEYLHDKNTIHRDIKPDNIMLSININGERTYKLADLGVARLINEGENAFTSLVGTEEYIHPDLYRAAVPDDRTNGLRTALKTRVDFPFEVDLWSLGVTLYQCATGELPFQPFAGTRKDRAVMKHILDSKPPGCISGVETTPGGDIQWSKTLPLSCRLSPTLKHRLEILLQRLLEPDRRKLMSFREFFTETDRILNLMPLYYLNLKRFKLTCGYFEPTQSITKLYDELHRENGDEKNEEYYCLFQNVPYPISKTKPMSIKNFSEQLPIPTSRENPLVFYTFSAIQGNDSYCPTLHIPEVKAIRQFNDVAAACEWSKDIVGLFFYVKTQLIEYQHILQTAQCSTTIMQQHLKSRLLEFLCSIRSKLIIFRAIEELKNIIDQIDSNASGQSTPTNSLSMNSSTANGSNRRSQSNSGENLGLGFSRFLNELSPSEDTSSSVSARRQAPAPPMQLIQDSTRHYLRSFLQPFEQLKKCEQDILQMTEKEFNGQLGMIEGQEPFVNTLWSSNRTKTYSSWISRTDKHLKDLNDLHESFRKDRLLNTYNRLQSDSHFRRRKNLDELHAKFIRFAEECRDSLVQIFKDYNQWIEQRSNMIQDFERIQQSYEKQCDDILNYVEMIDNLRTVVYKNIRELGSGSGGTFPVAIEANQAGASVPIPRERTQSIETTATMTSGEDDGSDNTNKAFIHKIRGTTKKTIQQAEEGLNKLDGVLKQLRTNMQKK